MGYPAQFRWAWGKRVIIEARRKKRTYVGTLIGEDPHYIYLEEVTILIDGKKTETPELALWKGRIGELKLTEEEAS